MPYFRKSSSLFVRRTALLKKKCRSTQLSNAHSQSTNLTSKSRPYTNQRSIQYADLKTPLHLQSWRENTVLISTFLLCFALWGWHLKYPGFYWKQIYYSRTEKNREGNYSAILSYFYNYCSLLEHAVTSYNTQAQCCNRIPHPRGNRSSKIIMDVFKSIVSGK